MELAYWNNPEEFERIMNVYWDEISGYDGDIYNFISNCRTPEELDVRLSSLPEKRSFANSPDNGESEDRAVAREGLWGNVTRAYEDFDAVWCVRP